MNKEDCEYGLRCLNNNKCYRCRDQMLLKLPKEKYKSQQIKKPKKEFDEEDSWKELEQQVADKLNKVPTMKEARRTRRSGALWYEQGDILDEILHPECKERAGRELKTGEKTISLRKEWLEKAASECEKTNKTMCLPFRFKNDETIYAIISFEDLANLITQMKAYVQDNDIKETELNVLKEYINKMIKKEN